MRMSDVTLILLAAGGSTRFGLAAKKQWLYQDEKPLWLKVADDFRENFEFAEIVIVAPPSETGYMGLFCGDRIVSGGNSRSESLANALEDIRTPYALVNDIARCCLDIEMIKGILSRKGEADVIVPALKVVDTVYYGDKAVDRDKIKMIQTPQLSRTDILAKALAAAAEFTDESSAVAAIGGSVRFVNGSQAAQKLTTLDDLRRLPCLSPPSSRTFAGFGIDTHAFEEGRSMLLGGVKIDAPFGYRAHSDGDVLIHALIDALLGAAGMGDIGEHFPDTDESYAGADSTELLEEVMSLIRGVGLEPAHVDLTILTETPRLSGYKGAMRSSLAKIMNISERNINIKATTSEKMGFIGRKEGTTVHAVATLGYYNWMKEIS